jgi:hypothetical protein
MESEDSIHDVLSRETIWLDKRADHFGLFDHVDAFVNLSQGNDSVKEIILRPFTDPGEDASGTYRYAIWDKIAEGINNLQALSVITIERNSRFVDALVPDWDILACILRRLRQGIRLCMDDDALLWDTAALPTFARAIHGQAMITEFCTGSGFPFHYLDILCSSLLTLPALENVSFEHVAGQGPEEGQSLESMVKLLQSPNLRKLEANCVDFTKTLSQAVAKALKERSEITDLHFWRCSFPEGGDAMIASAFKTNAKLKRLHFESQADEIFYEVLAAALLSNSTLQNLILHRPGSCSWLSPLFLTLQANTNGLKKLYIDEIGIIDENVSTAMKLGLGQNSTLESLHLSGIRSGDNDSYLWWEVLSFLRTNTALKTLCINFEHTETESHAAAIRMEVLDVLCENESLETLSMPSKDAGLEEYIVFVTALKLNTALKRLRLHPPYVSHPFHGIEEDETKGISSVLKKNYGLEEFMGLHHSSGDIRSIFELNRAGRRYLVQDGSSISKGVDVLSGVSNNINSVFLHLLENPRLCDRGAVEMSIIGTKDNARATSPKKQSGGKREQQAMSHTDNETRRRLE